MRAWVILAISLVVGGCTTAGMATVSYRQVVPEGTTLRLLRENADYSNRLAVLMDDLFYCYPPTRELIVVPESYATDFASVPPGAHLFVDRYGNNIEAAIVHDWLYAVGEPGRRAFADEVFRFGMGEQGTSRWSRFLGWIGVRAGGGDAYGSSKEWNKRFYDVETGERIGGPVFQKPASGVVATLDSCTEIENPNQMAALRRRYGSNLWPRSQP
jgi:Protein of unknown function (DUF1353).